MKEIFLDVSTLEPCEPLHRILTALTTLAKGEYLLVWHRLEPQPLYHILKDQGFLWRIRQGLQVPIEIFIWRTDDAAAESLVNHRMTPSL